MELGFGSSLLVRFQARRCSEIDNVVTAALLPHRPESSDVGVIGMITASARHRWTYRRRNGTKRKFFNDFSRACARVRARRGAFGAPDIMVTGTVAGAARLLNVSSPGISRVMKHAEASIGVKLFNRRGGRYSPTAQANAIFNQINTVYDRVEDLQFVISRIKRGANSELKIGSVPSIANIMVPRAVADLRKTLPNLLIEVDILKIEDAADYLLLGKGELVASSYNLDHSVLACEPLARGRLKCIVPETHPLARQTRVTADQIARYPLIGVDPSDPYGRIMAGVFSSNALPYEVTIRARFGSTVCALVS